MTFGELRRRCRHSLIAALLGATLLVLFAAAVRFAAGPVLQKTPVVTFYPAIAIATYMGGRRGGYIAAAGSVFAAWYLFVEPPFASSHDDVQDLYGIGAFGLAAVLTVEIIAWINRIQDRLEAVAKENHILFVELKHRIANNLQAVAALLMLHRAEVPDGPARRIMGEAMDRIRLIGEIHRTIYQPTDRIDGGQFLAQLCRDLGASLSTRAIECHVDASVRWTPEMVVPLALILHELIANALEHGIFGQQDGRIVVTLAPSESGGQHICVDDNGRGMPQGFDPAQSTRLGLKLIRLFAEQINATASWEARPGGGTRAMLRLAPSAQMSATSL